MFDEHHPHRHHMEGLREVNTPSQMDLVSGILKTIDRLGVKVAGPRVINACIKAANDILAELERPDVHATENMGLAAWLKSDDTGMSSKFMAHILARGPLADPAYPIDPSDFGRCFRFLRVFKVPPDVAPMAKHGKEWAGYVERWAEMERLYVEELPTGSCPKLYALMMEIQK